MFKGKSIERLYILEKFRVYIKKIVHCVFKSIQLGTTVIYEKCDIHGENYNYQNSNFIFKLSQY